MLHFDKQAVKVLLGDAASIFMVGRESFSIILSAAPVVVRCLSLEVGGERVTVDVERESGLASLLSKLLGHAPRRYYQTWR